jgi:hypothetical protein
MKSELKQNCGPPVTLSDGMNAVKLMLNYCPATKLMLSMKKSQIDPLLEIVALRMPEDGSVTVSPRKQNSVAG